jgi:hypothetical protein
MDNTERLTPVTAGAGSVDVAPNADFDARWAAWVARGRAHEQRARRRFLIGLPVVAIGAAIVFALFRS